MKDLPQDWIDIEIDEDGDELHSINQKKMEDAFYEMKKNAPTYGSAKREFYYKYNVYGWLMKSSFCYTLFN
jgi:hypothetical protein